MTINGGLSMKTCKSTCKFGGLCQLTGVVSPGAEIAVFSYEKGLTGGCKSEVNFSYNLQLTTLYII